MAELKCKMCGGSLEIQEGMTVCECEYCGTKQTVPSVDNEKKITLFGRANRLRFACEFDKAAGVYESIVAEFPEEAEAYWGLVLCKYGIEYVDDPVTGKKVPTCHRSSFDSVMDDVDFEQAMENADTYARKVYREEAKAIEELRKGIIEVSGKEQPYDIFICYKETDEKGERTIDSVIAQDVYAALTDKGYRVFFSRITLEDKLGQEYEPYIFAALNSAKVMLAFGTDYEYYNSVWVKNEWSRYLKLMAQDKNKHLIPCYKDIDAYDMPKEFVKLQSQDMGKVGAVQDLIRGIEKLVGSAKEESENASQPVVQQIVTGGGNIEALLKRGFISLEDGAFDEAQKCFDNVLNGDAENAEAYLGLFMTQIKAQNRDNAKKMYVEGNYEQERFWVRANQFAAGELLTELNGWKEQKAEKLRQEEAAEQAKLEAEEAEAKKIREKRKSVVSQYKQICCEPIELTEDEKEEQNRLTEEVEKLRKEVENRKIEFKKLKEEESILGEKIEEKKKYIGSLGMFKVIEKKQSQGALDELLKRRNEIGSEISRKITEVSETQQKVVEADKVSEGYSEKIREKRKKSILENLNIKDGHMQFGHYEQGNGIEPIEWVILKMEGTKAFLLSKYALDYRPYHDTFEPITWENCSLRKWLNESFFFTAFERRERDEILLSTVVADRNPEYGSEPGNDTKDYVFLLSVSEAKEYCIEKERKLYGETVYAHEQLSYTLRKMEFDLCKWSLRTPGKNNKEIECVTTMCDKDAEKKTKNYVSPHAAFVSHEGYIRPAIWIDLDA